MSETITTSEMTQMLLLERSSRYWCYDSKLPGWRWYYTDNSYWRNDVFYEDTNLVKPDSRVKPSEPLWMSPTAYPPVKHRVKTYGIEKSSVVHYGIISCYGKQNRYDDLQRSFDYLGSVVYPTVDTLWMLDLRKKIESETVNLGTAMAEYRQTVSMFDKMGLGLVKTYKAIRGKLPRKHRKRFRLNDVPGAYLQYTYGISPLVQDTFEAYLALQLAGTRDIWRRAVVTKTSTKTLTSTANVGNRAVKAIRTVSHRAIVYYQLDVNTPTTMGNPLEWAWELTPGSFILDWMVNIGDIINSLDAMRGVKALTGTLSTKTQSTATVGGYPGWEVVREATQTEDAFQRTLLNQSNIPLPSLIPQYQPSDSLKVLTNATAILLQLRRNDVEGLSNQVKSSSGTRNYKRHLFAILETARTSKQGKDKNSKKRKGKR